MVRLPRAHHDDEALPRWERLVALLVLLILVLAWVAIVLSLVP